jgi:hypothetical protein
MVMGAGAGKTRQAAPASTPEYLSNGPIIPQFLDGGETNQFLTIFMGHLKTFASSSFWYIIEHNNQGANMFTVFRSDSNQALFKVSENEARIWLSLGYVVIHSMNCQHM